MAQDELGVSITASWAYAKPQCALARALVRVSTLVTKPLPVSGTDDSLPAKSTASTQEPSAPPRRKAPRRATSPAGTPVKKAPQPLIVVGSTPAAPDTDDAGSAPTLSLAGRREIRQFAASASASSERDSLAQGAVQAAGPPNTPDCGDFRTAWASRNPNEVATLTLLYAELVTPTGVQVYQTYNPGFITRIEMADIYGEVHVVYEAAPQPQAQCPFVLVVPIERAGFQTNRVTFTLDQTGSAGGWSQIDAVELIGIKH